jgi:hypothetical protein
MPPDNVKSRKLLATFDFKSLFIEELGWNRHVARLDIIVDGRTFSLSAVSEKCGMVVFEGEPGSDGRIPDYATRRKIERQVAKSAYEHLIIYVDGRKTSQVWQWVRREHGKPAACREHPYHAGQPGDSLIQKLRELAVSLEEEECLTLPDVTGRAKRAFDIERVTKKFYDRFKTEHAAFLQFLEGIPDEEMERWYVSVMLNRLMFIYFIQKKGFLDNDADYLKNKLSQCRKEIGKDRYYRDFLCPLFFEGFAKRKEERSEKSRKLLGEVPYLNGGIFNPHQIEQLHEKTITIPDRAFEKLFEFFDAYHWHLDERPLKRDDEINPDVLGYIFEKYVNQKQMGAYYTKEDITDYISKNTVIPFLFDAAKEKCKVAFEGDRSVWQLLQEDPDRYIYPAVSHGIVWDARQTPPKRLETGYDLPPEISEGLDTGKEGLLERRKGWNKSAPEEYALPTEIWREVVARRKRYEEVKDKLAAGEVKSINDLITYNLDIRQFAQDVIENSEGPELLSAFWRVIGNLTVLDPTCGSGAFLFAALNILEPLYEACLDRMRFFLEEWGENGRKHHPNYHKLFTETLKRVGDHPNHRYFVFKSIIVNNLYGVDIMEEAVEICKLRLFLKLVAQIERVEGIEPLPDIDFNIRAGNTLVGFTSLDEVRKTQEGTLGFGKDKVARIEEEAIAADRLFLMFRQQQTELGGVVTAADKEELRSRLRKLTEELDRFLAGEYGIKENNVRGKKKFEEAFEEWKRSHRPFHWFAEFYGILKAGGFDIIIGNPPYLELREVEYELKGFACFESKAIHAMCMERGETILHPKGCMSMIVPLSLVSTQRMKLVQDILERGRDCWYANYSWRPGKLFDTVNRALTIFIVTPADKGRSFSTTYRKWTSDNRDLLIKGLEYAEVARNRPAFWIPKLGYNIERLVLTKCCASKTKLGDFIAPGENRVFYRTTGGLYWKVFTDFAPSFRVNGKAGHSTRETWFTLRYKELIQPTIAILSSDIFWWWYTITTNCRDLNPYDIHNFPIPVMALRDHTISALGEKYLNDLSRDSTMLVRQQKQTGRTETQCFKIKKSKPVIDEIDRALAKHYGFTDEELDFIINYDIKYRMGQEGAEDSEE